VSSRSPQVGEERPATSQPSKRDSQHFKLARFVGVMAGNALHLSFESESDSSLGASFDWDPWIRFMMPEFAVIMSANRQSSARKPTALIMTETGRVISLDRRLSHPSDASLLLSGEKVSEVNALIDALESAVYGMIDGSRMQSALQTVKQLRRICRSDQ